MVSRKTVITFGMVAIPIAMVTATQDNDIHFNQLHKEDNSRIQYKKTCAHCGKEISSKDIIKGYEYDKGKYVVITDEEIEKIKTEKEKSIQILHFAQLNQISPVYYEKTYQAAPEPGGEKAFELLRAALMGEQKIAIGKTADHEESLRFVIQHHMARREHYDFRLEWAGILLSWAVPKGPSYDTHDKRLAVQVEDHPLPYRNFEGTIPKGEYGGGIVMLWDEGVWEPSGNVEEGLQKGELKFVLKGRRMKGKWALIRLKAKPGEKKDNWLLLKEKDEYVKDSDGISDFTTSVRTGRTMEEIEKGEEKNLTQNPFHKVDVQVAKLVNKIPEGEDWIYEMKYDGYRIIAFVENNSVRLITRNGNDYQKRFSDIALSLIEWAGGRAMVLDGEMVITDTSGKTDFQALQNYLRNSKSQELTYIVFDLLALDGVDLRDRNLIDRKEMLEVLMKDVPQNLYYSRYVRGKG